LCFKAPLTLDGAMGEEGYKQLQKPPRILYPDSRNSFKKYSDSVVKLSFTI